MSRRARGFVFMCRTRRVGSPIADRLTTILAANDILRQFLVEMEPETAFAIRRVPMNSRTRGARPRPDSRSNDSP